MTIDEEKINNEIYLEELTKQVDKIVFHNDTNEAHRIIYELENIIFNNKQKILKGLLKNYNELVIKLKYVLFVNISKKDVFGLFKKHLAIGIKLPYIDLLELLKAKISFIVLPDRNEYKKQIMNILLNNDEMITNKRIKIGKNKIQPTIANWLRDYNSYLGTGLKNNLEQSKYFVNNNNFIKLDDLEKLELKELFSIYEYLKRSSTTLEGNEDNMVIEDIDGKMYILQENRFIDVSQNSSSRKVKDSFGQKSYSKNNVEKNINELENKKKQYAEGSLEKKMIDEELAKERKIKQLQLVADGYKQGSFERKAVLEEIEKMKKL